jgi:hypothetical protein
VNTPKTMLTLSAPQHDLRDGLGTTDNAAFPVRPRGAGLLERIAARNPQPEPDRRPLWLRRGVARDFTGRVLATDASVIDDADRAAARRALVASLSK